ncbi:MAG: hydroxyisourate hydrolase [Pseudomonadota bacterium]
MEFSLSTHVLELDSGLPAAELQVQLFGPGGAQPLAAASTDDDGRIKDWGTAALPCGTYVLEFAVAAWYRARGEEGFYPRVRVEFDAAEARHYHVPLLMNRFGYSTYRGS